MRNLLSGLYVRLSAIRESDLEIMDSWFNDTQFMRLYDYLPALPKQPREVKKYVDSFQDTQERFIFAVRIIETNDLIGIAGFDDILWSHDVATLFIGIGDNRYTAKGFGQEALQLLLDFGFSELNLNRIQLYVISYNQPAISLYESLGFTKEGTLRDFVGRDSKRYDMYVYSMLKEEWAD